MEEMDLKLVSENMDLKKREFILENFVNKFPKTKLHTIAQLNKFCKNKIIDDVSKNNFNNTNKQNSQVQTNYLLSYLEILN